MNMFCAIALLLSLLNCEEYKQKQQLIDNAIKSSEVTLTEQDSTEKLVLGAERISMYLPMIQGKQVGLVVNQTSTIGNTHLVDTLLSQGVQVVKVFAPEHGFRGTADAGEKVDDGVDVKTGLPIVSLYGKNKKPYANQLADLDILIFDIQDVGARFYTYISTMHYVMEAAAEQGKKVIILDRPNPNGHYVDGPVLEPAFKSFVGMHEVPVVHGMTVGEYAQMINGEGWLANGIKCDLSVIPMLDWDHSAEYDLPIKPSPNLPNALSITMYPSLCFFEGTTFSVGRGTNKQFQVYGHPKYRFGEFRFTPKPMPGAKYPKLEGQVCYGIDFTTWNKEMDYSLNISYLVDAYKDMAEQNEPFFLENGFFDKLAGTDKLRKQIQQGMSEDEISETWEEDLKAFREMRKKYMLYWH